ncbi:winged helix-turn-helix domain-containing protein [Enterovibrio norvegicus]|uniref:winged helix-turn-helix domain-containing protein n=1 Tax=Enterovibrio norvegicus TaxID=188144 RepID=UPI000C852617|nr:winged helix-turn-helix domain-containing protein [Enterovibrio norvegicus]PML77160.1 hypothetical protein BCT69_20855 [Enterovibrio norvegicus]
MKQHNSIILGGFRWERATHALIPYDPDSKQLEKTTEVQRLTQKQQDLICCLVDAYPNAVSKNDIIMSVWGNEFISSESLPQLINRTRKIIGDKEKSIIVNIPTVGYAIEGMVVLEEEGLPKEETLDNASTAPSQQPAPTAGGIAQQQAATPSWLQHNAVKLRTTVIGVLLFLTALNAFNLYVAHQAKVNFVKARLSVPYKGLEDTEKTHVKKFTINGLTCLFKRKSHELNCN